ncbi:hypothetical protein JTB14_010951 [Gonioctena quinquepunctata]|nr:hypothetical protein JTB14_010951 [Gonioctena quinquepunctata]
MSLGTSSRRIALITGANRGIGYETALALAKRNFKVIMADKADQNLSRTKIVEATCNGDLTTEQLDLASFDSVRHFADRIMRSVDHLDVLVNNAGVFCMNKQETVDNLDAVMQINHLGPFLLTNLLADLIKGSEKSRIIFVSSSGSFFHDLKVENLKTPHYFSPNFISVAKHYYNTKLCNMITAKGFAEKLREWRVSSNFLHPGMVNTNLLISSDAEISPNWTVGMTRMFLKCITRDVQDAAEMLVFLSTSERVQCISGKYFVNYQVHQAPRILEDQCFCEDIWKESEQLVGLTQFQCNS